MSSENEMQIPFKPYLIRAMIDWCDDNGCRPYLLVQVDSETVVPQEFVREGRITLSVGSEAVHAPDFGNDAFEFSARFGETTRRLHVPVRAILAAYPAEAPEQALMFQYEPEEEKIPEPAPEAPSEPKAKSVSRIQKIK